jgi:hypothetical protein
MQIEAEFSVFYPWYCHAIRGNNPFPGLKESRTEESGAEK